MDQQDEEATGAAEHPTCRELEQKLEQLRQRKGRYEELLGELTEAKAGVLSLTDPDARMLKGPHGYVVGARPSSNMSLERCECGAMMSF